MLKNKMLKHYYDQVENKLYSDETYTFYDVYEVDIISGGSDGSPWGCVCLAICAFPCVYTFCTGNPCCCGSL